MLGKSRNKKQKRRFELMQEAGCVPCWLESRLQGRDYIPEPPDIHHTDGQNHDLTYANCPWHHRGVRKNELDYLEMQVNFGPSLARNPERYRSRYGTESQILAFQEAMLREYCEKWSLQW